MQNLHPTKVKLAILTPVFAIASGWLCAAVAKYGVHLDPTMVGVALATGTTGAAAVGVKLIHDVEVDVEHRDPGVAVDVAAGVTAARAAEPTIAAGWPTQAMPTNRPSAGVTTS